MRTKLKQIIEEKGYNQNQVAVALGFHRSTLYNHVKAHKDLGIGKARKLATFLGITIEEVYAE
jgi:DNA-binding XRE family transcriptional regulator